ncbi:MAG: enoyl-CoA hydratase/isomerase [Alphaproteobacteria bacterium]|nr:enoyl-CoA hydratase/isomerase [Alphaproteobacteria bacterium]
MRTNFDRVYVTAQEDVAVLTLNHPEVMNAASLELVEGMGKALSHIEENPGFRAIVITGEGRGFCSGANLSGPDLGSGLRDAGAVLESHFHPLLRRLRDLNIPLVTAVNGAAAGVGMSLALMGDIVLAARSAYFLQAFARIGLVPDGGSTWLLPRLIGLARARELSMLAEKLPAEKALEWGLINRVCDDASLMDDALAMAHRLAQGPASLALIRRLYWQSPENSYEAQINEERQAQRRAGKTSDFGEGVAAFLQKRPAKFTGQ